MEQQPQQSNRRRVGIGAGFPLAATSPESILQMAQYSPQVALALVKRVRFAPYNICIRAAFVDSTVTLNPVSFDGGNLSQPSVCDSIEYEIQQPNAFPGTQFKAQSDYFFGLQSGIQCILEVQGAPRYTVTPFFAPIRAVLRSLGEAWPHGWVLQYNQTVSMQFQQSVPVPSTPTNIICTFRLWQPAGTDEFVMMTTTEANRQLEALGWATGPITGPYYTGGNPQ
jgi:hypothetical protein